MDKEEDPTPRRKQGKPPILEFENHNNRYLKQWGNDYTSGGTGQTIEQYMDEIF